ncbi:MAG: S24 family peptidase [Gammaproteobacteria bacterium]|nr:S24 family peptidase [Gammaproteobacteria bacterium]MBU1646040.1 S24 family peptidase [Gammaproteobacteria bacterium]MBU1972102.1 S24 family peptidase [Gammaproteobacteria bacterium]
MHAEKKVIPIFPAASSLKEKAEAEEASNCAGAEPFALMVLGDSMEPEFIEGDIIIIEPEGLATDGSYVFAWLNDEWIFRQLVKRGEQWLLSPLNPAYPAAEIADLEPVRGVIIQKSKPGRRKEAKRYVE